MVTPGAALLLSGGMDSTCLAFWLRPPHAITIDYGQRPAAAEIRASRAICEAVGIQHHVITADCSSLGSGEMAAADTCQLAPTPEWWPFRNQLLITLASAKAIALGCTELIIGTLASDTAHADGTHAFLDAMDKLLRLQEGNLRLIAPARDMTVVELICKSEIPPSILQWAFSCHIGNVACGHCRGCRKQRKARAEAYDRWKIA